MVSGATGICLTLGLIWLPILQEMKVLSLLYFLFRIPQAGESHQGLDFLMSKLWFDYELCIGSLPPVLHRFSLPRFGFFSLFPQLLVMFGLWENCAFVFPPNLLNLVLFLFNIGHF